VAPSGFSGSMGPFYSNVKHSINLDASSCRRGNFE
jgi:hypothetical protein